MTFSKSHLFKGNLVSDAGISKFYDFVNRSEIRHRRFRIFSIVINARGPREGPNFSWAIKAGPQGPTALPKAGVQREARNDRIAFLNPGTQPTISPLSRPKRTIISGTFFLTSVTAQRRRLFLQASKAELFLETLQEYRRKGLYKLHAFVAMPDHAHLLITTDDLPYAMKHIRGGFSHKLPNLLDVWKPGYTDRFIQSREDFLTHRDYIHQNPVRARLCQRPEDYPYSSAYRATKAPADSESVDVQLKHGWPQP